MTGEYARLTPGPGDVVLGKTTEGAIPGMTDNGDGTHSPGGNWVRLYQFRVENNELFPTDEYVYVYNMATSEVAADKLVMMSRDWQDFLWVIFEDCG